MITDREIIKQVIDRDEGGFVNNPKDPGGMTYRGISRRWFKKWSGWNFIDNYLNKGWVLNDVNVIAELEPSVLDLYETEFWNKYKLNLINLKPLALVMFSLIINRSGSSIVKDLQKAINDLYSMREERYSKFKKLVTDGKIGAKSINAVNNVSGYSDQVAIVAMVLDSSLQWYRSKATTDILAKDFGVGWINRVYNNFIESWSLGRDE
jgi:lysozyme family protein